MTGALGYLSGGSPIANEQLAYTYDDENRLVEMRTDTSSTPSASRWRSTWVYDGLSHAWIKTDYTWSGGNWAVSGETRYLYDGRRVIRKGVEPEQDIALQQNGDFDNNAELGTEGKGIHGALRGIRPT